MPRLNAEWHQSHRMPAKATFEQRVEWHREHNQHCACRPGYPQKLREEATRRGVTLE